MTYPAQKITSPTLLVDKATACANIERMVKKVPQSKGVFKPHFKTHQSKDIAQWYKTCGVEAITVSSVKMAEYFAQQGWTDITIAFPCNLLQANRINKLAQRVDLSILISSFEAAAPLVSLIKNAVNVYVEIDTGSNRTGFSANKKQQIGQVLSIIQQAHKLQFKGFYTHAGHSYQARSVKEIEVIYAQVVTQLIELKQAFLNRFPNLVLCMGDTPCCSTATHFKGIDEISAGNFVFYDLMQTQIGSCRVHDIAVALACPVVATYPQRNQLAIHGGAIHLSKEQLVENGQSHYGKVVKLDDQLHWGDPIEGCYVQSISQEHGIVQCSPAFFDKITIGDIIGILPVHSCLTADTMKGYWLLEENRFMEHMQGIA